MGYRVVEKEIWQTSVLADVLNHKMHFITVKTVVANVVLEIKMVPVASMLVEEKDGRTVAFAFLENAKHNEWVLNN